MSALTVLIARLARPRPERWLPRFEATTTARLSAEDQLIRLANIVSNSLDRARISSRCHAAAEVQLDAAAYALRELMQDLAGVMTLPDRRNAALYQLSGASVRVVARRRVAYAA
jgi:hypothetical protein